MNAGVIEGVPNGAAGGLISIGPGTGASHLLIGTQSLPVAGSAVVYSPAVWFDVVNAGARSAPNTGQSSLPLTGTATYSGTLAANSSDTLTVAFPSGRFTKAPLVNANGSNSRLTIGINSVTKDAVTFALGNWTSGAAGAPVVYYTATPRP